MSEKSWDLGGILQYQKVVNLCVCIVVESDRVLRVTSISTHYVVEFMHMHYDTNYY